MDPSTSPAPAAAARLVRTAVQAAWQFASVSALAAHAQGATQAEATAEVLAQFGVAEPDPSAPGDGCLAMIAEEATEAVYAAMDDPPCSEPATRAEIVALTVRVARAERCLAMLARTSEPTARAMFSMAGILARLADALPPESDPRERPRDAN